MIVRSTEEFISRLKKYSEEVDIYKKLLYVINFVGGNKRNTNFGNIGKLHHSYVTTDYKKIRLYRYKTGRFRIIFSMSKSVDNRGRAEHIIIFLDIGKRDNIYNEIKRKNYGKMKIIDINIIEEDIDVEKEKRGIAQETGEDEYKIKLFDMPREYWDEEKISSFFENKYPEYLVLSGEQKEVLNKEVPVKFVSGKPGTGKTVLLMREILKNLWNRSIKIVITFNPKISFVIRKMIEDIRGKDYKEFNLYIYSFEDFVQDFLAPRLGYEIDIEEIGKPVEILKEIISRLPEYKKYEIKIVDNYIRALFKGRIKTFNKEGVEIFTISSEDRETAKNIAEIFSIYKKRLKEKELEDIYDIYYKIYHRLNSYKEEGGMEYEIYIDELQDFSEIERNIIFKIVSQNNRNKVFITGDKNQQISLVGFEWETVGRDIKKIFNNERIVSGDIIHLNKNYRNPVEIIKFSEVFISRDKNISYITETGIKPKINIYKSIKGIEEILKSLKGCKNTMFITYKKEIEYAKIFDINNIVFNYKDAKGLENDIVIMIEPFSIIRNKKAREILFMSITRARKYLYIFSTEDRYKEFKEVWKFNMGENLYEERYMNEWNIKELIEEIKEIDKNIVEDFLLKVLKIESYYNLYRTKPEEAERLLREVGAWEYLVDIYKLDKTHESYYKLADIYMNKLNRINMGRKVYERLGMEYLREKEYEKAIDIFTGIGDYGKIGDAYDKLERYNEARENYEKAMLYEKAGDNYEKAGKYEKAIEVFKRVNAYKKLGNIYEILGKYKDAGENYEKAKLYEKAGINYEKAKLYEYALKMFNKIKNYSKIGYIYETLNQYEKAIENYIKAEKYEKAGDTYVKVKQYKKAIEMFKKVNEYKKLGKVYEILGKYEEAGKNYEQAKLYEKAGENYEKAKKYEKAGDNYEQAKLYEKAIEMFEQVKVYKKLGNVYEILEKYNDAGNNYEKAREYYKALEMFKQIDAYNKLGKVYEILEDYEIAGDNYLKVKEYEKAIEMFKKVNAYNKLGKVYEIIRLYEKAGNNYENAREYDNAITMFKRVNAYDKLGEIYEILGKYEEAGEIYEKEGEFEKAGDNYKKAKLYEKAIEMFKRVNEYEKLGQAYEILEKYNAAGENYKKAGLYEKAGDNYKKAKLYEKAIEMFKRVNAYDKLGEVYKILGRYREAGDNYEKAGKYEKAIEMFKRVNAYRKLGNIYEILGKYEEAGENYEEAKLYEKAIEMFNKVKAYKKLGQVYEILERYRESGENYDKAKEYEKAAENYKKAKLYEKAGEIYEKAKLYEKAIEMFKRVNAYDKLGEIYEILGKYREAGENYKNAKLYGTAIEMFKRVNAYDKLEEVYETLDKYLYEKKIAKRRGDM